GGVVLVAWTPGTSSRGSGNLVCFKAPSGAAGEGSGGLDDEGPLSELWNLKEWILEHLTHLYDCQQEEIMALETDMDELLDMRRDGSWMARVKQLLVELQTHRGLHLWPVEQDPQHAEAEHTLAQKKSTSLTLVNGCASGIRKTKKAKQNKTKNSDSFPAFEYSQK
uniref:Uncharacterized protein n=1 Tax=Felis catus TaxID=9685 RepID=A0ABI7XIS6_FELCA